MKQVIATALLAGALAAGSSGAALAWGNSDSGSGLSPYSALNGNDRSAGVNNGNYRNPRTDPYLRTYGYGDDYDEAPRYRRVQPPRHYYGYPY
ncbi:hypothetical protein [Methylobacterium symbioticum]|jgi:hypothetical protein|uniref:Uncharacterized protein n=1 Tax=Methylobacterium symbioticum TaxID=2584084 RepID=A0A509E7C3_9HYPH|nr:hypothetical protein [Methylobacterium symbioticum]VUD69465.1 hypothetical protein MET9862_00013 [Methylobacterium symbioticum]